MYTLRMERGYHINHPNRQKAREANEKHYWSAGPCENGHDSPRFTSTGRCVECHRLKMARHREVKRLRRSRYQKRRRQRVNEQRCDCCTGFERNEMQRIASLAGLSVDHIIPLHLGGPHCVHNMALIPANENCRKSDQYDPLVEGLKYLKNLGLA